MLVKFGEKVLTIRDALDEGDAFACSVIYSDNIKTFLVKDKEWKTVMLSDGKASMVLNT